MNDEQSLFKLVCEEPENDFHKWVLADYLMEKGSENAEAWLWIAKHNKFPSISDRETRRYRWLINPPFDIYDSDRYINCVLPKEFQGLVQAGMSISCFGSIEELYTLLVEEYNRLCSKKLLPIET